MNTKNKTMAVLMAAIMVSAAIVPMAMAGKPAQFNEIHEGMATVHNSAPTILCGYFEILDNDGNIAYKTDQEGNKVDGYRQAAYIWESEKLVVYAKIHDPNGISDFYQHTTEAWLSLPGSPTHYKLTDMEMYEYNAGDPKNATFRGEKLIPSPDILKCHYDITITDTDKYGISAENQPHEIFDCLFINPEMSSTFTPDIIRWLSLEANQDQVPADTNPHILHVDAECAGEKVNVSYELKVRGTDFEGGISNAQTIPCSNVEYNLTDCTGVQLFTKEPLTNPDKLLGEFKTCCNITTDWMMTTGAVEPGDYHGEVGFDIKAM